jgi:hypothetical protein
VFLDSETKRLHVPNKIGARLKVKLHRPLQGTPKTAHLVLRADGHWYVLIVCDLGEAPPKREGEAVGIDVGLTHFVADSEGSVVENPRCFKNSQNNSVGRNAKSQSERKAPIAAAKHPSKRPNSTSRSPASVRTTPTRRLGDTLTLTPSSPLRICV